MAEIIEAVSRARGGRRSAYPWDEWLDGQARRLTRGEDFQCLTESFRTMAHTAAKNRGKRIIASVFKDYVEMQACDRNGSES